MKENKTEIILCDCNSSEHQVLFRGFKNDLDQLPPEIYLEIHLSTYKGFFKRLWIGIRYAFGHKSRYGHWDEIVLSTDHIPKLKEMINFLEENNLP